MDDNGNSKGFGYVHFEHEDTADKAIEKINGMSILGQIVYVGHFVPRTFRQTETVKPKFNNLYVKSFAAETTDESLREMFAQFGEIISCVVSLDTDGKSKGFGFVCFKDPECAEAAYKAMNGKEIGGKQLYVNRAQRKDERLEVKKQVEKQKNERSSKSVRGVNLYVKNLDDSIDDASLEEAFSIYGCITSAKVMRDSQGRSKGFGFVCFTQEDEATRAVCEMHTTLLGSKPLYVALAQRKDERRQQLMNEINSYQQTRIGMPSMLQAPNAGFLQQAAFSRPPYGMMNTQPRWNRPTGMPASMPQVNMVRPLNNQYFAHNANTLAHLNQMRQPNMMRSMLPAGVQPGVQLMNNAMMSGQNRRPVPSMAQITANGLPQNVANLSAVRPAVHQPRQPVVDQPMHRQVPIFNQPPRPNPAAQANPNLISVMSPLGDQINVRAPQPSQSSLRKTELGERLFAHVAELDPARAPKITGMLLGLEEHEIINLMQSKESLKERIDEAVTLIEKMALEQAAQNRGDINGPTTSIAAKDNA